MTFALGLFIALMAVLSVLFIVDNIERDKANGMTALGVIIIVAAVFVAGVVIKQASDKPEYRVVQLPIPAPYSVPSCTGHQYVLVTGYAEEQLK
jgi:hypothetical protein